MMEEEMEVSSEDDILGPSDAESESETAAEILARLEKGWLNEKLCPELLVPLTEEVECMQEQLVSMEKNLKRLASTDIRLSVHKLELSRVRYVIVSYLRTRLFKIQEFAWQIQDSENKRRALPEEEEPSKERSPSKLMAQEQKFLKEYLDNLEEQLTTVATQNMPVLCQTLNTKRMMWPPNLDKFVFFRVNTENRILNEDANGEELEVHLEVGTQHVMRYRPVAHLLHDNSIQLM